MPRGDKSAHTVKQKRQAPHTEKSYVERGLTDDEADARAWAIVNKASDSGKSDSGKPSGSGRRQPGNKRKAT